MIKALPLTCAGILLALASVGCDQKPTWRGQSKGEAKPKEKPKPKYAQYEGQTLILQKLKGDKHVSGYYHVRPGCPKLKAAVEQPDGLTGAIHYEALEVSVKNGRIVDEGGFYRDKGAASCEMCVE